MCPAGEPDVGAEGDRGRVISRGGEGQPPTGRCDGAVESHLATEHADHRHHERAVVAARGRGGGGRDGDVEGGGGARGARGGDREQAGLHVLDQLSLREHGGGIAGRQAEVDPRAAGHRDDVVAIGASAQVGRRHWKAQVVAQEGEHGAGDCERAQPGRRCAVRPLVPGLGGPAGLHRGSVERPTDAGAERVRRRVDRPSVERGSVECVGNGGARRVRMRRPRRDG